MKVISGNLLSNQHGILVHGCNCQGVMGGGIAASIRSQYPEVYARYAEKYHRTGLPLGDVQLVWNPQLAAQFGAAARSHLSTADQASDLPKHLVVANAMTQEFYGRDPDVVYVDYDAVFSAFARIRLLARDTSLPVRFPLIGAGLANGDWRTIQNAIKAGLREQFDQCELWVMPGAPLPAGVPSVTDLLSD